MVIKMEQTDVPNAQIDLDQGLLFHASVLQVYALLEEYGQVSPLSPFPLIFPYFFLTLFCGSGCYKLRLRRPRELGDRAYRTARLKERASTHPPAAIAKELLKPYAIKRENLPALHMLSCPDLP